MFTLTDALPWEVEINGKTYNIDMSFDNVLSVIDILNNKEIPEFEQVIIGLRLLLDTGANDILKNNPPEECVKIFLELFEELINTEKDEVIEYDIAGNPMPKIKNADENIDVFDIKQDAQFIYASFMQDYHIDLFEQQGKMHWWQFLALLHGLRDDTKFKKVIEIRTMEPPTGKGTEKQRRAIEKLKKIYALKPKNS